MTVTLRSIMDLMLSKSGDQTWFNKCLNAGNAIISLSNNDYETRYRKHQAFNRAMQKARAKKRGEKIVLGFFKYGTCEEISLFGCELEEQFDYSSLSYPLVEKEKGFPTNGFRTFGVPDLREVVIGYGCADLVEKVKAQFNICNSHNWMTIEDWEGCIMEYDAESGIFQRCSNEMRHRYSLMIDKNGYCTPIIDGN